jgi:hypothetical protein
MKSTTHAEEITKTPKESTTPLGPQGYTRRVCSRVRIGNKTFHSLEKDSAPTQRTEEPPNKCQNTSLEGSGATVGYDN